MKLILQPEAPFNFKLSSIIFSNGDLQIQKFENNSYWQVIRVNRNLVLITVRSVGSVDAPELSVTIKPDNDLNKKDLLMARNMVKSIFNLDFKLRNFYDDMNDEKILSQLIPKLRGLNSPTTPTFFESIITSIIEQQISLKAARSIENHMIKKYGEKLTLESNTYFAFPTPEILSKLKKEDLRECGLSFRKSEYVIGLSNCIEENKIDLNGFKNRIASDVISELMKIRGIGRWTAELAVVRGLHRLVTLLADDIGLRRVVAHYYTDDKPISGDELREIAKGWGRWSGLAAFYLIVAELMSVKI